MTASLVGSDARASVTPRHLPSVIALVLASTAAVLALVFAPAAFAAPQRIHEGSFSTTSPGAIGVDPENGDVYTVDYGNGVVHRYDADGDPKNLTAGPDAGTSTLGATTPFSFGAVAAGVAVDRSGGPADGNIYVLDFGPSFTGEVHVFSNAGAPLGVIDGATTPAGAFAYGCGISVNQQNGDLYVGDENDFTTGVVYRYSPSSGTVAESDYSGGIATPGPICRVAAAKTRLYTADIINSGEVRSYATSDFATGPLATPSSTLIDTGGSDIAVDRDTADVYINKGADGISVFDATGVSLYGFGAGDFGFSFGLAVSDADHNAYVADGDAEQLDVYGPARTVQPPTIVSQNVASLTTVEADLKASIGPGGGATSYHFELGPNDCSTATCTHLPSPDQDAGGGTSPITVTQHLSGLTPSTTYHFRVVATNETGSVAGPDRTFTTYGPAPSFDPCSNDDLRTGGSARLPDCRAFERATPADKNGTNPQGIGNAVQASPNGDAITFTSQSGFPGGVGAANFGSFMARRGLGAEWASTGLLPPLRYGNTATVIGWTSDLRYSFSVARSDGRNTLLRQSAADSSVDVIVPPTPGATFAYAGSSADGAKVYFEAVGASLTASAASGKDNLYVWDASTGDIALAGLLPGDATPPQGSFAGSYDWWHNDPSKGGALAHNYTVPNHAISENGDRAYFTAGSTGKLYLRKGAAGAAPSTVEVSASQRTDCAGDATCGGDSQADPKPDQNGSRPAEFQSAGADGSFAYFTSREELTDDANTAPDPVGLSAIGRADLDGSNPNPALADASAQALAVDGTHIYWADTDGNAIGRADLDGSNADPTFITGAQHPNGVVVDASHVYWTNSAGESTQFGDPDDGASTIGRADIDGSDVTQSFISGATDPQGIDVDAGHVYWVNRIQHGDRDTAGEVGRANLDGTGANQHFIAQMGAGCGGDIAVSPSQLLVSCVTDGSTGGNKPRYYKISTYGLDGTGEGPPIVNPLATGPDTAPAIAVDGTHIYWTFPPDGTIRRMDPDGSNEEPAFVSTPGPIRGLAVDGAHVYWSTAPTKTPQAGRDLYRYDADSGDLTDITPDPTDADGAAVQGVLGTSDDGSSVYFAAGAVLASGTGADGTTPSSSDCVLRVAVVTSCNLYLWHAGVTTYVARLAVTDSAQTSDSVNWVSTATITSSNDMKTARVSADGRTLLFRSYGDLTSYDNTEAQAAACGSPTREGDVCPQYFRYTAPAGDAPHGNLDCVSCNPTGAPPSGGPKLQSEQILSFDNSFGAAMMTRNLSADGNRVLFETVDPLVAQDTNGDGGCPVFAPGVRRCQDVYEWVAAGSGSCPGSARNGGCLYLVSSGQGNDPAFFGDASASGDDAFVFTSTPEVPADQDQLYDIYNARVGGGLGGQHQAPAPTPCAGDGCQAPSGPPPGVFPNAGSLTFFGAANAVPPSRSPSGASRSVSVSKLRAVTGSVATVKVKVPGAGSITVSGTSVRKAAKSAAKAATYVLKVRLSAKAAKTLAKQRRLTVKVKVAFRPKVGSAVSKTITITFTAAKKKPKRGTTAREAAVTRHVNTNRGGAK